MLEVSGQQKRGRIKYSTHGGDKLKSIGSEVEKTANGKRRRE